MKQLSYILGALLIVCMISSGAEAQDGLAMMKVEAGARPAGLGGAFVSISGDAMSPIYNPAAAVGTSDFLFGTEHCEYWENISFQTGYLTGRVHQRVFLFAGIRYAAVSDLEYRRDNPSAEPEGIFDAHDISFKGGLAFQVDDQLSIGVAAGWFFEKVERYTGSAFNFDIGALYKVDDQISVGISATNIGSDFSLGLDGQQESRLIDVPKTFRLGLSYKRDPLLTSGDIVILDDKAHAHVGAEYDAGQYVVFRAGYMSGYDSKSFSAGGSVMVPNYKLALGYAYVPYSNSIGTTHQFSLTYGI